MIELLLDFADEQSDEPVDEQLLQWMKRAMCAVLENEGLSGCFEISLSLVDKPSIQQLNAAHRQIDKLTDVLSFPLGENGVFPKNRDTGALLLGDIVICAARAAEQAEEYGHSRQREFAFLCAHSTLHLLGYDHVGSAAQAHAMECKQEAALEKIGLAR